MQMQIKRYSDGLMQGLRTLLTDFFRGITTDETMAQHPAGLTFQHRFWIGIGIWSKLRIGSGSGSGLKMASGFFGIFNF
jgi:hypothetical protein